MTTLTPLQKIQRAHFYIMNSPTWVAYSGILMLGNVTLTDTLPDGTPLFTAATDGWNVWYNPAFIDMIDEPGVRAIVLHETLHKMYRHPTMWRHLYEMDEIRANKAVDYVANAVIKEANDPQVSFDGIPIPALYDKKYTNMDAGSVYRLLPATPPCPGCGGQQGKHAPPGQGKSKCKGGSGSLDEHDWDGAGDVSKEEQRKRSEGVDAAIRQGAQLAGKMAGNIPRDFSELMDVKIDYREVLKQFVTSHCKGGDYLTFRRPSRRHMGGDLGDQGIVMPSAITEVIESVVIGVDTSGSIGGPELNEFISNVIAVLKQVNPQHIDLLYWDTQVAGHEVYYQNEADKLADSTKPKGGGGTAPSCVTTYMAKNKMKPTCVIMLTDGWTGGDFGQDWPCPVLWVIKDNPSVVPTIGAVAHM